VVFFVFEFVYILDYVDGFQYIKPSLHPYLIMMDDCFDEMLDKNSENFLKYILLDIFFIYISNIIPKVPYTLPPPCSPTHPLLLPGPGIPLYWGI
jgi:F0F1-type ATP synthase membrane subunit a